MTRADSARELDVAVTSKVVARFWERVNRLSPEECWPFRTVSASTGYGVMWVGPRLISAHRVSYAINCDSPGGSYVLHKCDSRSCVNPNHLFLGTHGDNMRGAADKGRFHQQKAPRRTHCPQGHQYTAENVLLTKGKGRRGQVKLNRVCRICNALRAKRWRQHVSV